MGATNCRDATSRRQQTACLLGAVKRRGRARYSLLWWSFAVLLAFTPWQSTLATDYNFPIFPRVIGPGQKLHDTADMKTGLNAAPWLPAFIDKIRPHRPPIYRLNQIVLIRSDASTSYLAILWGGAVMQTYWHLEFHKVVELGNNRRRIFHVRGYHEDTISIEQQSGMRLVPGNPPIALVEIGGNGLAPQGYALRLFQMKRNTVDITPAWTDRIVDLADIDGDGTYELVTMNSGWIAAFSERSAAGPHLPVVLALEGGDFVPACRKYAAVYKRWIDGFLHYANDPGHPAPM